MPAPSLHPDLPPIRRHELRVDGAHVLAVSEHGAPDGIAALVLHGGPGSGGSPLLRRFFDARRYRVVCVDQRGAGASTPRGSIARNTTVELLADLRAVREALGIERWLVVGGSWGATLALAHAVDAPQAVAGLLLRAVFLARREDIAAFFAAAGLEWPALARALNGPEARAAALAWWRAEQRLADSTPPAEPEGEAVAALVDRYRVQSHYLANDCFLSAPTLLERCESLPRVPALLLHGSEDRICPPASATLLQRRAPGIALRWVDGAGHDPTHPAMVAAMVGALDHYAEHGDFGGAA